MALDVDNQLSTDGILGGAVRGIIVLHENMKMYTIEGRTEYCIFFFINNGTCGGICICVIQTLEHLRAWYLYKMVAQNMLRTYDVK